jgi:hypothetical protein
MEVWRLRMLRWDMGGDEGEDDEEAEEAED